MKKLLLLSFIALLFGFSSYAQNLKPYTMGTGIAGDMEAAKTEVKAKLKTSGFKILGEYKPANDANRWLIVITSSDLLSAVKKEGGLTGFAAALRVALTKEGDKIVVSYTTPEYWGNAYFQSKYSGVEPFYANISSGLKTALGGDGTKSFGSKKGLTASKLQKYHYMMGMPYFDDNVELKAFSDYNEAVTAIEKNLADGVKNLKKIYSVEISDKKIKLYGIGLSGEKGESKFLPTIDINSPRHTAFLPYEMLVLDNKVFMLHGRFRIALSFPDLTMGTFMKIVSTPGNIEDMLKSATE